MISSTPDDVARAAVEVALPAFVASQRWFSGKSDGVSRASLDVAGGLPGDAAHFVIAEAVVEVAGVEQRYFLPLAFVGSGPGDNGKRLPIAPAGDGDTIVADAGREPGFVAAMIALLRAGTPLDLAAGILELKPSRLGAESLARAAQVPAPSVMPISGEQSNTTVLVGDAAVMKFYRLLRNGIQPELEVTRFLTEQTAFTGTPALFGSVDLVRPDGTRSSVAAMFALARNEGDAWSVVTRRLAARLGGSPAAPDTSNWPVSPAAIGAIVGRRTGEMHAGLATVTGDPDFDPEPIDAAALEGFVAGAAASVTAAMRALGRLRTDVNGPLDADIDTLFGAEAAVRRWLDGIAGLVVDSHRTRIHGDYHLGQLLVSGADVVILDFEGEPGATLDERREKSSPLRDVAGMIRSFDYAAFAAIDAAGLAGDAKALAEASLWRDASTSAFLSAWSSASGIALDGGSAGRLLDLFLLQKAFYELTYEAASRPAWLSIPLRGILSLLDQRQVLP